MDRTKKRGKMKIRSWTCRGYRGYQDAVHPELHKMLLSLGGNSIFAELAITETVRLLAKERDEDILVVRAFIIANDFGITLQAEHGSLPIGVVQRYRQTFGKNECLDQRAPSEEGGFLSTRTIRRILSPVEYAILAADGRTATLLFRFPFTKTATESAQELARKIYLEKDDVICQ